MLELRARYSEFWARRERARAAFRSGRSEKLELARIFDEFADLAGGEPIERLARERETAASETAREAARRLLRAVQARVLEARSSALELEIRARVRAWTVRVGKRERPLFAWLRAAVGIEDAQARAELQRGLDRCDAELAPLRAEWRERRAEELAKLGFDSPLAWAAALRPGVALDGWREAARELLARTESAWHDALRALRTGQATGPLDGLRALALPPRGAPAVDCWDALDSLSEGVRLRLRDTRGVALDQAARERADPRPFLSAARVPGEIALALPPRAPLLDLAAALALGARAMALAFTSESLPVERRLLGDRALALAWGELFAQRLADPAWLERGPFAARADDLARQARALGLARLRFAAVRTLTELEWAQQPAGAEPRALADAHAARVREALGWEVGDQALLRDCRAEPAALDELRAACLAAQLAERLRERHGREFWRARACGDLLRELWHTGSTYGAEELASQLDLGALGVDLLCPAQ